jgi:hypothetical protein
MVCCADAAFSDNNAKQPMTAADDKFLILELKCMAGFLIWVVCLCGSLWRWAGPRLAIGAGLDVDR